MQDEPRTPDRSESALATGLWAIGMTAATSRSAWPPALSSRPEVDVAREPHSDCAAPRLRWLGIFSRCPA